MSSTNGRMGLRAHLRMTTSKHQPRPRDIVWVDFPHFDKARRARDLDAEYCSIFGCTTPSGHFVILTDGKTRPMLVVGPKKNGTFSALKMTSNPKYLNDSRYYCLGKTAGPGGVPRGVSLVDLETIHVLPARLVSGFRRRMNPARYKLVCRLVDEVQQRRPPLVRDP